MFACHLHNSSGMCLHLARTNHVSAESPSNISPKSYPKFRNPRTTFEIFKKTTLKNLKAPIGVLARLTLRSVPHHHRHGFGGQIFWYIFKSKFSQFESFFVSYKKITPTKKFRLKSYFFTSFHMFWRELLFIEIRPNQFIAVTDVVPERPRKTYGMKMRRVFKY